MENFKHITVEVEKYMSLESLFLFKYFKQNRYTFLNPIFDLDLEFWTL